MARPVVADSDVLIDYFAGASPSAEAVRRLLEPDRLAVTSLTVFELCCGVQREETQKDIELLINAARIVLRLNTDAAQLAAHQYRVLKGRGEALPTPDLLIAGCCLAANLPLLTRNRQHFSRVAELELAEFGEVEGPD